MCAAVQVMLHLLNSGLLLLSYSALPHLPQARWMFSRPAILELTHNWGTESDAAFSGYHSGNAEPKGFGHIGLAVPDVYAACERFEKWVQGLDGHQADIPAGCCWWCRWLLCLRVDASCVHHPGPLYVSDIIMLWSVCCVG